MKAPEIEVIRLTQDVVLTSSPGTCTDHCTPIQSECTPICTNDVPGVCDCVEGDD